MWVFIRFVFNVLQLLPMRLHNETCDAQIYDEASTKIGMVIGSACLLIP